MKRNRYIVHAVSMSALVLLVACTPEADRSEMTLTSYVQARSAYIAGDLDGAARRVTTILQHDPEHVPTLVLAGRIAFFGDDTASAYDYLKRALAADVRNIDAAWWLSELHLSEGRFDDARPIVEEALRSASEDPRLLVQLARIDEETGALSRAIELYERALLFSDTMGYAAVRLGDLYRREGFGERATRSYEHATRLLSEGSSLIPVARSRMRATAEGLE